MNLEQLGNDALRDENEAYAFVESRVWPNGPVCPHCQSTHCAPLQGASTRVGVRKCYSCRKPFRVTVGTAFHAAHVPLAKLCRAIALIMRGYNAAMLGRDLGLTHGAAWKLSAKIRAGLRA